MKHQLLQSGAGGRGRGLTHDSKKKSPHAVKFHEQISRSTLTDKDSNCVVILQRSRIKRPKPTGTARREKGSLRTSTKLGAG